MRSRDSHAILVVDLAFGDCGKGTIVDFLARRYSNQSPLVVRFNGGPQAGHNVATTDRRHHTFSQFGSGMFVTGVETVLSRFVLIEPYALLNEAAHLRELGIVDPLDRLMIDARCPVITPAHQAANRLRELLRGRDGAHGTCGLGVGEAIEDQLERREMMLCAGDLANATVVAARLNAFCDLKLRVLGPAAEKLTDHRAGDALKTLRDRSWIGAALDNYAAVARLARVISGHDIARVIAGRERIILEGAQGGLLDETFGFHPYTTWSSTNFSNAERLLDESEFAGRRTRMGILRSYFTRHGAGPLVSEDRSLHIPEPHNNNDGWQGDFRVGPLDTVAARYAIGAAGGIDALAITHLDALSQLPPHVCTHYRADGEINADWFTNQGDLITDIRRRPFADLNVREQLTRCLKKCAPVFSGISREPNVFVAAIRRMLHAPPLAITSWGPTAHEKRIHDPRL